MKDLKINRKEVYEVTFGFSKKPTLYYTEIDYKNELNFWCVESNCGAAKIPISDKTPKIIAIKQHTTYSVDNLKQIVSIYTNLYNDDKVMSGTLEHFKNRESVITDGYHTFGELYSERMQYDILLSKIFHKESWRSKKHDDGSMFDGYFIMGYKTNDGDYTHHYKLEYWGLFNHVQELTQAPSFDGHSAKDAHRLLSLLK